MNNSFENGYEKWKKEREKANAEGYAVWKLQTTEGGVEALSKEIENRVNTWLQNNNNFISNAQYRAQNRGNAYVKDSKEWLATVFNQKRNFDNEAKNIKGLLDEYKAVFNPEWVSTVNSLLDANGKEQYKVLATSADDNYFWSQFENEDDYNHAVRINEYRDRYSGKSYEELLTNINALSDGEEKEWLNNNKYWLLPSASDFADNSQYKTTYRGGEVFNNWTGMYSDTGYDDIMYDYINRDEKAVKRQQLTDIQTDQAFLGIDDSERKEMSDEEISIFNYLYATQGSESAYEFIKHITSDLNARQRATEEAKWAEYAKESPIASSAFSVVTAPLKGLSYLGQFADYVGDGTLEQNAGYNKFSYTNTAIRNEVSKQVESKWGGAGSFAYQTGMSLADFLFTTATTGGGALTLAVMGSGAAADMTISAKDRGLSDAQAFSLGTIAGVAEAAMEKIGLDALFNTDMLSKSAVKYIINNALAEGFEEVGTDVINTIADIIIAQDQSLWQTAINNYMAQGKSESEAFGLALADKAEEMGLSFLGGAISGGVIGGGGVGVNTIGNTIEGSQQKKQYGSDIGAFLADEAVAINPEDSFAKKMQAKATSGKELSSRQVGKLIQQNETGMRENDMETIKSAAQNRLNALGETVDVETLALALAKQASGVELSRKEKNAIKNSKYGQRVANELNPDNINSGEYSSAWAESIGTDRINVNEYNRQDVHDALMSIATQTAQNNAEETEATEAEQMPTEKENAVQSQYEVSADGKTINTKSGEVVNIKNIESISENGEANLTLDDGMVVKASDLSYGTDAEGIIIGNIGKIKIGKNPISTTSANALYMTAMSALKSNPNMTADEAMSIIKGLEESYVYGAYNFGESKLAASDENGSARLYAGELSQSQRRYAYELGTKDAVSKAEADQKVIDDLKAKAEGKTAKKSLGKIIFEKGAEVADESALTDTQRANLNGIKLLAEISSVEFHVFRSDKNNNFKYTMPDGTVTTANGWFVAGTNQIWVDLNAGNSGEGTMVRTAAHEISHYIKEWSPQKWRAMADMLMEEFAKNGVDTESMLNKQIAKIKRRYNKNNMPSQPKLLDMAYEELVCDALSDMLTDGSIVNFIAKVKAKDASLGKKIINAIKNLLKKWGLIIDSYKGRDLDTAEAQALSQFEDTFKKLQELYRDAFMDANATVELVGGDVTGDTDIDGAEGDHLLSDRSMVEGAGLRFIPTKKDGKRVLEYRVEDADGNIVTEVDEEMIKDSPLGNLVASAVEGKYISEADAEVQYKFLAELVNMCLQYKGIAPVWETAGTLVFSAIKNNADKQYGKTIDFSTVCKKTQAIVDAMSEAMLRLGRGLTRAEVETIYLEVGKAGEETPCPVCYVFSRWMGIGGILDQMSRFQNKYVPMKDADIRAFMEDIEARIDKRANTPNKNGELKAEFFDKDGNIKQGQVIADLKNKASSKAASALKALSKNSDIKLQIQELEALAKTQDAKGKKATEKKMTSLKKKLVDVSESEAIMKSANDEVELYEAYQWLTRTLMVKDANDNWVRNKDFKSVPMEVLFDLNKGDEFASGYPLSWAFRTGKGASAGKAIMPYADARVGETIQGIAKSDIKDIKVGLDLNPFLNGDKQTQKKLLETARLKQLRQNLIGGQRYQSTSDFRYEYGSDYLITFLEMQAIGAKVQLYTKVIEAVDFLATVGAECNLSVMPLSDGFITLEDGTKKLVYSSVTGINGKAAIEKTHQYNNVQLILVGISDEHIRLALEGDEVTFVIPFHGSGNSVHQIQALMNLLGENLDVTTAQDYTPVQSDHHLKEKTQAQKDAWNLRKKIIMGKAGTLTANEHRILKENQFLDDMYRRFYEDESAEEYGVALTKDQANQIFPYEYWDKSLTYDQADQNGERFKQYCETLGIVPRFSGVDSDGKNVGFGDFTNAKGYWKLLIDRRMYENVYDENGNWVGYGKYHHPKTIDVTNFKAETIDPKWGTAHYGEVMAKSNDPKKTNKIVDAALAQFENKGEIKPSERDSAYLEAVNRGDIETAQRMVDEAAKEAGYTKELFHGTHAKFNSFDISKSKFGNSGYGFYFGDHWRAAEYGGDDLVRVYLKADRIATRDDHNITASQFLTAASRLGIDAKKTYKRYVDTASQYVSKRNDWMIAYELQEWAKSPQWYGKVKSKKVDAGEILSILRETLGIDGISNNSETVIWDNTLIKSADPITYDDNGNVIPLSERFNSENDDIRYSLRDVDPVEPTSNQWQRTLTTSEVKAKFPDLWDVSADESEVRNPTQISGTVRSYRKVYDFLKKTNFKGTILDASSGLGYGTKAGIEEYGFDVEDIEPYPDKSYSPKYTDYSALDKKYDVIISNAVLNVLPQDQRDALVVKMGELLKDGGRMFINVRGDDVKNASSKVAINESLMEYYISKSGSYQKGFTKSELVAYLQDALGDGFSVTPTTFFGKTSAVVTKNEGQVMFSERVSNKELASMDDTALYIKNTKKANYIGMIFNGTKTEETRSQRTLDAFIGKEFYVTDGKYVYGSVVFGEPHKYTEAEFHKLENQKKHRVPKGDKYDIKKGGIKWAYPIESYNKFDKPKKLSDSKEYKNSFQAREAMFSERDTSSSNRAILANALEGAAQSEIERNKLAQYKEKIALIETEEQRLSEIQKKLFTKGAVEPTERKSLQFEAKQISNRINTYDRQLLNLESTTALKNVLNREKALAMKRQKQKDTEYLKQYKEKVAKTQRELLERNQESRKKAIEGREKTAMRHKIKSVVNDLNNLLLKPSKERHVPEEMRIAVAEALAIVNMDTVDADTRVAHYNDLIAKAKDPDVIASLTETRDRILNQGNKLAEKLTKLKDAYSMVRDSADDSLRGIYDDVIYSRIESVQKVIGKTPLRNMTLGQLESVYDLYKMVLTTIRDSNKAFAENITQTRLALGSNTFAEIKEGNKARDTIKHPHLEKFLWQNLKPMQAMKTIGSGTLQKLWNNILYGQETFAQDYDEAVKFAKEMKDKHGYEKWNKDKLYSFDSKSGKVMKLNLEQIMSIYAYSKRAQADEHIEYGGIVLNEGVIKVKNKLGKVKEIKVNDSTAYRLDKMQVASIVATLEKVAPGAKAFVDEMQKYLSETMGEKGNEVAMKMYGIKLFKEEHYFPLKSSKDFMEAANAKLKGDVKIKNKGMTKSTVEHARNPIVLENFLDVWGNHVNEMAMYHGLVLPLEDFSRTLNYSFKADDQLNTDAESVRTALHDAFGDNADDYLNELLKAINGGVLHDSSAQFADRMISKFKKSKVMGSLSVIVQQPTAIIRAMSIIEPKYFVAQNFNHKATWEELKKYCPTAIIKETGSFDTNMGRTIVDMIKDDRGFTDKVGDVLGKAPAYMDEMGWNMIWRALKKKVATEQNLSGEALLQECGKQMTLIINETQVYDSVMSRNELMRSKSAFTKMATAFMAEPTTVANMIYGAALDFNRGKKGLAGKAVAATIASVIINSLVSAIVYAMRDDDEEKTFLEKYISSATTEVIDGLNPLTYIPFVKDAYSLFQGYDVERTDMALIGDVVDAINDFYNVLDPEKYEGMSEEEITKHIYENSVPLLTAICDMFGLPVGNVLRDAEAIIVQDNAPMSQTSPTGTLNAFKEGILSSLPQIVSKVIGTESKQDQLYDAIVSGDTAYIERLKSGYKDEASYETAVRKALRENDERIKEAAEAYNDGDIRERDSILDEIVAEGFFDEDLVFGAITAEANALKSDTEEESEAEEEKATSIYKADDVNVALESGDKELALEIIDDLVKTKVENGMEEDKAKSSVKSSVTFYWKPLYKAAYKNKDSEEMTRIRKLLFDSGLYGRASQVSETCRDWIKELAKEKK